MAASSPVSVLELARLLPALMEQHDALDEQSILLIATSSDYYTVRRAMDGVFARICATEDMILATPAVTLADAAGQLLMAASKVRHAMQIQDLNDVLARVERLSWVEGPLDDTARGAGGFGSTGHAPETGCG